MLFALTNLLLYKFMRNPTAVALNDKEVEALRVARKRYCGSAGCINHSLCHHSTGSIDNRHRGTCLHTAARDCLRSSFINNSAIIDSDIAN